MGPIERELVQRYDGIHRQLIKSPMTTKPSSAIPIKIVDKSPPSAEFIIESLRRELDDARKQIAALMPKFPIYPTIQRIIDLVCSREVISKEDILGHRRMGRHCEARHIAMYLAVIHTNFSLPQIAYQFGKRDHTTAIHARNKITKLRSESSDFDERLGWYSERIGKIEENEPNGPPV
jgi:hypothetical protein